MHSTVQGGQIDLHLELRFLALVRAFIIGHFLWLIATHSELGAISSLHCRARHQLLTRVLSDLRSTDLAVFGRQVIVKHFPSFICATSAEAPLAQLSILTVLLSLVDRLEGIILQHYAAFQKLLINVRFFLVVRETQLVF